MWSGLQEKGRGERPGRGAERERGEGRREDAAKEIKKWKRGELKELAR